MLEHLNPAPVQPGRVVVMGAGGFVGGAIAARLARDGVQVLPLARKEVDLLAPDAHLRLSSFLRKDDSFVAVSALAPVKNPDMLVDNVVMARAMAAALARSAVSHVVNIGSDAIYADSASPLTEESCASPGSLHGAMHLARELLFRSEIKAPLAMLRPSLLYGAADPHNGYGPNRFRRLAMKGEDIALFGEGEERRDHVFIDDVAELAALVLMRRSAGALNVATGEVRSFREIAEYAVKFSGKLVGIRGGPRSGPMPHGGYRPFGIGALRAAFPAFRFTPFEDAYARSFQGAPHG
jgi:nucleoside-diphosphate-sugar epimerase